MVFKSIDTSRRRPAIGVALEQHRPGKPVRMVISIRPDIAAEFGYEADQRFDLQIGEGEHHGFIRLRPDPEGGLTLRYHAPANPKRQGLPLYNLRLQGVGQFVNRTERKQEVRYGIIDGFLQIRLPSWADETKSPAQPKEQTHADPDPADPAVAAPTVEITQPAGEETDPQGSGSAGAEGALPPPDDGARYRLTNGAGMYLHKSGSGLVSSTEIAYVGTRSQIEAACRAKPSLRELELDLVP